MTRRIFFSSMLAATTMAAATSNAAVVYDNSSASHGRFDTQAFEIGDQIILGGSERTLSEFRFQFYTSQTLNLNEQARVRFYTNPTENSPPTAVFYDSGWFNVGGAQPNGANFIFTDFTTGAMVPLGGAVPNSFTWTVQFQGIDSGEQAGLYIFGPPSIGNNYSDYWEGNGGVWTLKTLTQVPTGVDFAAQFSAVPEPSTVTLGLLGVLGLAGMTWRKRG